MNSWQPVRWYSDPNPTPAVANVPADFDDIPEAERQVIEQIKREGKVETQND